MTPILPAICTTHHTYRQLYAGIAIGAVLTIAAIPGTLTAQIAISEEIQRVLRAGCKLPSLRGEASTWAIGSDGELNCWEQRDRAR